MKKRFKKIYVEITNKCNLNCSFCSINKKEKKEMTIDEFNIVISKIKKYTDYIYLHIKGEPLLHNNLDELLTICDKEQINVNITTNGTLIKEKYNILDKHKSIRQINISLHCENNKKNYFEDVFETCKKLSTTKYICYRLWTLNDNKLDKESTSIVEKIKDYYNLSTEIVDKLIKEDNIKIFMNTFVNKNNLFDWPDINNNLNIDGKCYGLINQLGILSDGTVVPCCLDSDGIINLGNIFKDSLDDILNTTQVKKIIEGFNNNKSICKLCKNCNFRYRFIK
jgi:radical SAM protein with 4Fe4S-binding SPASM domain